ncbi:MAG: hypothetical protein FWE94_01755, partial [Coriobacteriia bacterium]|nr:hypothetical protein [Coriobacteriia bacterium]
MSFLKPRLRLRAIGVAFAGTGLAVAVLLALSFPPVAGLGTRVRMPVFHGALTWVNIAVFAALGVTALVALIRRSVEAGSVEKPGLANVLRYEAALRKASVAMWVVGTVLGLLAALKTWDFSASESSPMDAVLADPRLMAQFWILLAGLALLAVGLITDNSTWRSACDLAFVGMVMVLLARALLGSGRALHPDSPVLNSPEPRIKALFFGMVAALALSC